MRDLAKLLRDPEIVLRDPEIVLRDPEKLLRDPEIVLRDPEILLPQTKYSGPDRCFVDERRGAMEDDLEEFLNSREVPKEDINRMKRDKVG